jgi:pyruvate dehydrogenase E2 component (dihydrolipoamide acetyltransferase)
MAKDFKFPDVGEGMTEGEIVKWLVEEGDEVTIDQTLAEIETDKAIVEMPSPYAGTVLRRYFKNKDIVKVGQVLVTIGEKGETPKGKAAAEATIEGSKPVPHLEFEKAAVAAGVVLATPRIRKLAQELGVDLGSVTGTGPQGRITEEDVRAAKTKIAAGPEKAPAIKVKAKYDFYGSIDRIPLRGVRRATAKRMAESVSTAAHVTHFDEADVTELAEVRERLKAEALSKGVKLTFLPFIIKALITSLKLHPLFNASLDDENEEILVKKYYNIGIAVDIPEGLIVPVIKAADQKTLFELAQDIQSLAESAKARSLDLADLKGGTFSITNVGAISGEAATPIINYPEVAILATMKIADRVRAVNGLAAVRKTLPLCLSFDHRVVDGAEAARFMKDLIGFLERPGDLI